MKNRILIAILAVAALAGCKSQYEMLLMSQNFDEKYAAAMEFFEQGKYSKATQLFESLSTVNIGTERDDTVHYYHALSSYRFRDYQVALESFRQFIEFYPKSRFTEEARFYELDCMFRGTYRWELDQAPTRSTIAKILEFKDDYPSSVKIEICNLMLDDLYERLERKEYENARLYYNLEDYKASRIALANVLKSNPENRYREEILYLSAMSSYRYASKSIPEKRRERFMAFTDDYLNYISEYPEGSHRSELDALNAKVKKEKF